MVFRERETKLQITDYTAFLVVFELTQYLRLSLKLCGRKKRKTIKDKTKEKKNTVTIKKKKINKTNPPHRQH